MYEHVWRKGLYPLYERSLRGRKTFEYLAEYEGNQWLGPDEIEALQWSKLRALIAYAGEHVPFYQRRWREAGVDWRDIRTPADFQRLPILTKDDIRGHREELVALPWRGHTFTKTTGGSTGEPLSLEYNRENYERRMAVRMRGYAWSGARIGRRTLMLWGVPLGPRRLWERWKSRLYDVAHRTTTINSFELRHDNLDRLLERISACRPEVIISYVAPMFTLARHALAAGRRLRPPEAILTGAEPLYEFQRKTIEEAFRCPVYNTYGCREFMLIASECAEARSLHWNADHLALETVDAWGGPVGAGRSGDLLITDLHNYAMPFIRYAIGDRATLEDRSARCACGRGLPRMSSVDGRGLDVIQTVEGRLIPGEFFPHLLKDVPGLARFQVIQDRLDHIEILMVQSPNSESIGLDYAARKIREQLGPSMRVDYHVVDEIPLTPTGKQRVTLSRLAA